MRQGRGRVFGWLVDWFVGWLFWFGLGLGLGLFVCCCSPLTWGCKIFCYHNIHATVSPVVVITLVGFFGTGSHI